MIVSISDIKSISSWFPQDNLATLKAPFAVGLFFSILTSRIFIYSSRSVRYTTAGLKALALIPTAPVPDPSSNTFFPLMNRFATYLFLSQYDINVNAPSHTVPAWLRLRSWPIEYSFPFTMISLSIICSYLLPWRKLYYNPQKHFKAGLLAIPNSFKVLLFDDIIIENILMLAKPISDLILIRHAQSKFNQGFLDYNR